MKRTQQIRMLILAMLGVIGFALTACNTVEGAGEDLEDAGEAIEEAAEDAS